MRIVSVGLSHVGRRNNNEDAYCVEPQLGLYAVADGMGGYEGGEVASRLAIDSITAFMRRNASDDDVTWPYALDKSLRVDENLALVASRIAHHEVLRKKTGALAQMGSTLAIMFVCGDHAVLAHLGDSRIYRLRAGALEQLTQDHSVYAEMMRLNGGDMPPKAETSFGHMITRALGMEHEPRADIRRELLQPGDTFLLCTDGLTEIVTDEELAISLASEDLDATCRALVSRAYEGGGRDNITAVLARALAA